MPRLSADLDLVFTDHSLPRDAALARINDAIRQSAGRLNAVVPLLRAAKMTRNGYALTRRRWRPSTTGSVSVLILSCLIAIGNQGTQVGLQQAIYLRTGQAPELSQPYCRPVHIPWLRTLFVKLGKWPVGLCQHAISWHCAYQTPSLFRHQHCGAYTEPAAQRHCTLELSLGAREPVQDRRACPWKEFQAIKHRRGGAAAVNGQDSPAHGSARAQYVIEDRQLGLPVLLVFRTAVEPNFPHVLGLGQVLVKQLQFAGTQMR